MRRAARSLPPLVRLLPPGILALACLPAPAFAASILFIGNSFTYGALSPVQAYHADSVTDLNHEGIGGVPALFKAFAEESQLDYDVSLETAPGMNLDFHLEQKGAVITRAWDHVILQPYSTLDAHKPGDDTVLIRDVARLDALLHAQNPGVDLRLVATWSRADQVYQPSGHWYGLPLAAMARDILAADERAAAASPGVRGVIAVGTAWNRVIDSGLATANPYLGTAPAQIDLWASDHYHASSYGYYLEALMIFGSVTGRDPRLLGEHERAAAELGITPAIASALQLIAQQTLAGEQR